MDFLRSARFDLGLSYRFEGGVVGVDGSVQLGQDSPLGLETEATWNVRAGAMARLSDKWSLGGGLFTDNSGNRTVRSIGDMDVNYYGVALGTEIRTTYPLSEGGELVMTTTLGLRYALGVGEAGAFRYEALGEDPSRDLEKPIDVIFHEVALHVGSGFSF